MSVTSDLKKYSKLMSVKFILVHSHILEELDNRISRYLQKYITDRRFDIDFSSYDINEFITALEKTHKSLNKIGSHMELRKKFDKYKVTGAAEICKELKINEKIIIASILAQRILSSMNRYSCLLSLLEESVENTKKMELEKREKEKKESDDIFKHAVYEALISSC